MDEFDIFRARAYGGYVEQSSTASEEAAASPGFGLNGNPDGDRRRKERSSSTRRSVRKISDVEGGSEALTWSDHRSTCPGSSDDDDGDGGGGERKQRSGRNRAVAVAVEPPSPTADGGHQRSQSWRTRQQRCQEADCDAIPPVEPSAGGLHRTRTMPARRSASPRRRSPACLQPVIVEPTPESPTDPSSAGEECRIYRVRSFTTKKGGIVNRGDSIKICNSRRASRCDNTLLVAPPPQSSSSEGGLSRRNSTTSSTGRSSLQPFQPSPCQMRRSSASCIETMNNNPTEPSGLHGGHGQGRLSQSRSSFRSVVCDAAEGELRPDAVVIELIPGRRVSVVRMHGQVDSTGGFGVDHTAAATADDIMETLRRKTGMTLNDVTIECAGTDEGDEAEDEVYNVKVIGSNGVGKTTLIHQLLTSEYLANKENYQAEQEVGEEIVSVQLDDVESMVHFEDASFSDEPIKDSDDVDAYLVVYSVTDRNSFVYCQSCLHDISRRRKDRAVMLVANKQDLVRNRLITEAEGKRLSTKRRCEFLEVSALLDHRVDEVLVTVIRLIRRHRHSRGSGGAGGGRGEGGGGARVKGHETASEEDLGGGRGCIHKAASAIYRKLFK